MFTFGHIGTFSQHWLNVRYDEKGPSPEELSCEAPSQCWDTTRNFSRHLAEPLYVFPPALSVAGTLQNIASTGSCCTNTWETWGILNVTYHYIPIHTHIYIYRYKYTYIYNIYIYTHTCHSDAKTKALTTSPLSPSWSLRREKTFGVRSGLDCIPVMRVWFLSVGENWLCGLWMLCPGA